MKRILLSLLAVCVLVACGAEQKPPDATGTFQAAISPPTNTLEQTTTPSETRTTTSTPTSRSTSTLTLTPTKSATPTITPTPTETATPTATPPPLPLRDDLPAIDLRDWPRPANDNGECLHFVATGYYDDAELDKQIARLKELKVKWALVLYADENHLALAARKFKDAGIMVVWRKTLRPYQRYLSWGRDIDILNAVGMPPYMQLYNEPELPAEWDGLDVNRAEFMANLLQATKDVYNAGGYVGIQFLDEDDLRQFVTELYARAGEPIFHRMFFIAHAYGGNHPPDYVQDTNGVLGFRTFATIFFKRLGFVPPILVGEGGWKIGNAEDNRFPAIDETLHRDYTLNVFNWFRTGQMANDAPLPDYLFAFCHWMLAGANEAGAWYDSSFGNRTLTIEAVKQLPIFTRKFSWDK